MATSNLAFQLSDSVSDLTVDGSFIADNFRQNSTITLITEASSQLLERDEAVASPAYGTLASGEGGGGEGKVRRESEDRRTSISVAVSPEAVTVVATAGLNDELQVHQLAALAIAAVVSDETVVHSHLNRKLSESVGQTPPDGVDKAEGLPPVDDPPAASFPQSSPSAPLPPASLDTNDEDSDVVRLPFDVTAVIATSPGSDDTATAEEGAVTGNSLVTTSNSDNSVPDTRSENQGYDNRAFTHPSPISPLKSHKIERSLSNKSSSSLWSTDRMCRICWIGEDKERCVAPCHCAGSYALVHQSCLQRWLAINNRDYCEICRFHFNTNTSIRPMCQWNWKLPDNRHVTHLRSTAITLAVVTPILICGIVLCSQKISDLASSPDGIWKSAALTSLVLISTMTYVAALGYFARKMALVCNALVDNNRVTIIASITTPPPPGQRSEPPVQSVWALAPNV